MSVNSVQVRDRLRTEFLGRYGIHGLHLDQKRGVIEVFLEPNEGMSVADISRNLAKEAEPLEIEVIQEPAPVAF